MAHLTRLKQINNGNNYTISNNQRKSNTKYPPIMVFSINSKLSHVIKNYNIIPENQKKKRGWDCYY